MARSRTLGALIGDVRAQIDEVGSQNPADSEITEWINQAWAELYDELILSGDRYYLTSTVLTLTGATYPLPLDCYKVRGVDAYSGGLPMVCHRINFEERNDYALSTWSWPLKVAYDIQGPNIMWFPTPSTGQTARLWYYPVAIRMSGVNDTIDGVNGWEVFVVYRAAQRAALKLEQFDLAAVLQGLAAEQQQRIVRMSASRDAGEPGKTRVTRGRLGARGFGRWWRW